MKSIVRKSINGILKPLGLQISRRGEQAAPRYEGHTMPSCHDRLKHAARIGFEPKCIVDAGAFTGDWTLQTHRIFPDASYLVIEPNPHTQDGIRDRLADIAPSPILEQKAVADETGMLTFNIWGDPLKATSASLQEHVKGEAENRVDVEVTTLDSLLNTHNLSPDLIKLDLQGAEVKALRGAASALKTAEMFIVEFGCLQAYIDRATPHQLMEIFYDNDYCLYDIVDCHYRPYDGALTGGDFFFVKNSSSLKTHLDYE